MVKVYQTNGCYCPIWYKENRHTHKKERKALHWKVFESHKNERKPENRKAIQNNQNIDVCLKKKESGFHWRWLKERKQAAFHFLLIYAVLDLGSWITSLLSLVMISEWQHSSTDYAEKGDWNSIFTCFYPPNWCKNINATISQMSTFTTLLKCFKFNTSWSLV